MFISSLPPVFLRFFSRHFTISRSFAISSLLFAGRRPAHALAVVILYVFALPVTAASTVIDVLVVYTGGVSAAYDGDPSTRFNQLFQVSNQIYKDSGVNLELRLAGSLKVAYTDDTSGETALNDITSGAVGFSAVAAAREKFKADMVLLYRPYREVHGSCGVAWIAGQDTNGDFSDVAIKNHMFAHVAINTCGDFVTAHELGHNMGLRHSRKQDGAGGTFPYALGHGMVNSFTTIMADQNEFNVDYWDGKVYKFSNPELLCKNQPCGVDRTNTTSGADARYAINITAPQIANFYKVAASSSNSSASQASSHSSARSSNPSTSSTGISSAAGSVDLAELAARVNAAKATYDAAVAAVNANARSVSEKVSIETTRKWALTAAMQKAKTAKAVYDAAASRYKKSVAQLSVLQTQLDAARVAYEAAGTATRLARQATYESLLTKYNALQVQVAADLDAVSIASTALGEANKALAVATQAYSQARNATAAEKAKTAALKADASASYAIYKDLQVKYKAALAAAKYQ